MRTPRPVPAVAALVVVAAAVGVAVWRPWEDSARAAGGPPEVSVSRSQCGQGWTDAKTGRQTISLHNTGDAAAEVDLVEVGSNKVYGEVEGLGPNTSAPMDVQLGAGRYAIRCLIEDTDAITGPTVTVAGDAQGGPAAVAVTKNDMLPLVKQYEARLPPASPAWPSRRTNCVPMSTRATWSPPGPTGCPRTWRTTRSARRTTRSATSPTRSTAPAASIRWRRACGTTRPPRA